MKLFAVAFVALLVLAVVGNAEAANKCRLVSMQPKNWGACAAQAKWLLANRKPSVFHGSKFFRMRVHQGKTYTRRDAKAARTLKYRLGWPRREINGAFGPILRAYMLGDIRRPIKYRVRSGNRRNTYERNQRRLRAQRSVSGKQWKLKSLALQLLNRANLYYYTQGPNRSNIVSYGHLPPPTMGGDCSSTVLAFYKLAGLPPPGGTYYGWTGTIATAGRVVWRRGQSMNQLRIGDLILYGNGYPYTHVTMYIGNGRVFSQGSDDGPYNLPVVYRYDVSHARRFL